MSIHFPATVSLSHRSLRKTDPRAVTYKMPTYEGCCAHDHDCEASECGPAWSLHEYLDHSNVRFTLLSEKMFRHLGTVNIGVPLLLYLIFVGCVDKDVHQAHAA